MPTLIRKVNTLLSYCLLFMSSPTTTSILRDYRQAMAQWQASARVTASAAVMGSVRSHTAAHGVEWNVKDSVSTDSELQEALQTSCVDDDHKEWVEGAIAQHLEHVLHYAKASIERDLIASNPRLAVDEQPDEETLRILGDKVKVLSDQLDKQIETEHKAYAKLRQAASKAKISPARQEIQARHEEELRFVIRQASRLRLADRAQKEVQDRVDELAQLNVETAGSFYDLEEYKSLNSKLEIIKKDRIGIEQQLTSFFDHQAQGAIQAEYSKPDKYPLKIEKDLVEEKKGHKQIQGIDSLRHQCSTPSGSCRPCGPTFTWRT